MNSVQRVFMTSAQFVPKGSYILAKAEELEKEEESAGGIVIPKYNRSSMERPTSGTVVEVGPEVEDIKPTNFILWPMTDGIDLEFDDGEFILLRYESVIGLKR